MGNKELELTAALSTLYRGGPELFRKKNEPNTFCPKNLAKCAKFCWDFANIDNCCDLLSLNCFWLVGGTKIMLTLSLCSSLRGKYFLVC